MADLRKIIDLFKGRGRRSFRLVPLDWWKSDGPDLPLRLPAIVGRGREADVRLDDPWISRIHCELYEVDGQLMVRDLESRHGVYLNEERVAQAPLRCGDVLLLGVSRYRVEWEACEFTPAPPERQPGGAS